ncbi:DUF4102 domain-containing protein [Acinetobacter sp. ANC 3781]|uniref:tyrosine-type recombinase/integrase n=1 Tax=Acinetobacter sp. ANC 3781 TaxID=2529835 RepID=UPI00103C1EF2|nr:integrase arm-type DNA-binding domain-containing protein [Acinetobacter sp. ANC 3781]TCB80135.1 DUF4102 domain-containing protein [Acinetobacter sp. ANC 3781]
MLNDTKIKKLKPMDKPYRIADQGGLCIEVRSTGAKLWRVRYRFAGKASMISLGEYPIIGLAEARQKQEEIKTLLANNIDPAAHRQQQKLDLNNIDKNSFAIIANEYAAERLSEKSQTYIDAFRRSMEKDVFGVIGHKNIKDVTSADVLKIMQNTVKRVQDQNNRGTGEVTAIENRKKIGSVMRYAIATLRAENDPTYAVREVIERPEVEHARPLTLAERKYFRSRIKSYGGAESTVNSILCLFYTMLRTVEIRRMQWSFIDFENKTITFEKQTREQLKKGMRLTKKNKTHIVPMSEQVYQILLRQKKLTGRKKYVFEAVYNGGMMPATTINRALQYIMQNVTAHDFRATASTLLNELGYDEKWIEKQLAHQEANKTKATYDHSKHLTERRQMLQDWADIIDSWEE